MPVAESILGGAYAELPGVKLWFTDSGGSGVPVVLLHPNTGTVEIWEPQIAAFAATGYRVIAFDRKGWGKSVAAPATGEGSGSIAGDLNALADHLKLEKNATCSASPAAVSSRSIMQHGARKKSAA